MKVQWNSYLNQRRKFLRGKSSIQKTFLIINFITFCPKIMQKLKHKMSGQSWSLKFRMLSVLRSQESLEATRINLGSLLEFKQDILTQISKTSQFPAQILFKKARFSNKITKWPENSHF